MRFCLFLCICFHFLYLPFPASCAPKTSEKYVSILDDEITRSLFPYLDDPFAEEDRWADLSDSVRAAWTASHQLLSPDLLLRDFRSAWKDVESSGVNLDIGIQLAAPVGVLSQDSQNRINRYASAMHVKQSLVKIRFNISLVPPSSYHGVAARVHEDEPARIWDSFQPANERPAGPNRMVAFVKQKNIVVHSQSIISKRRVGTDRTSLFIHGLRKDRNLRFPNLLVDIERAAQSIYAPDPLFFPVPLTKDLSVHVIAYTPNYEHRAPWLDTFSWNDLEYSFRKIAVHGQQLRFSSSQINAECLKCAEAFRDVEKGHRDFITKAAAIFNKGHPLANRWTKEETSGSFYKRGLERTFQLIVLDLCKLRKGDALQRLLKRPISFFPGMGIIVIRSNEEESKSLPLLMTQAFVAGVYGLSNPKVFLSVNQKERLGAHAAVSSAIMFDIMSRNVFQSISQLCFSELDEIIEGLEYFDVDPKSSLGDYEYAKVFQRMNLILFKLKQGRRALSNSQNGPLAVHLAASTAHDIRAINLAFGIREETRSYEHFRDPALRCHFSRLERSALTASQLLESGQMVRSALLAVFSFVSAFLVTTGLGNMYVRKKSQGKKE